MAQPPSGTTHESSSTCWLVLVGAGWCWLALVGAGWTGGRAHFCCPARTPAPCPGLVFLRPETARSETARRRIAASKSARSEPVPALSGTVPALAGTVPARRDMTVPTPPGRRRAAATVSAVITVCPSSVWCTLCACGVVSPPALTGRTGVCATKGTPVPHAFTSIGGVAPLGSLLGCDCLNWPINALLAASAFRTAGETTTPFQPSATLSAQPRSAGKGLWPDPSWSEDGVSDTSSETSDSEKQLARPTTITSCRGRLVLPDSNGPSSTETMLGTKCCTFSTAADSDRNPEPASVVISVHLMPGAANATMIQSHTSPTSTPMTNTDEHRGGGGDGRRTAARSCSILADGTLFAALPPRLTSLPCPNADVTDGGSMATTDGDCSGSGSPGSVVRSVVLAGSRYPSCRT